MGCCKCLELRQAMEDLKNALQEAGYINMYDTSRSGEEHIAYFWFDYIYDNFYGKSSEKAMPHAERR